MASEPTPEQSYCADQARRNDRDRFLCALFAPRQVREALFSLIAFNGELARTRDVVSQPLLGQIRLQWWRDAVAAIYGDAAPSAATATHPILVPLARAIADHNLERATIDAMIDARSDELEDDPFGETDDIQTYVRATAGNLAELQTRIIAGGRAPTPETTTAIEHANLAWGIVELIRMRRLAPDWIDAARPHVASARALAGKIDVRCLPTLLPATLAETYIAKPNAGPVRRQVRLALNAFRRKY